MLQKIYTHKHTLRTKFFSKNAIEQESLNDNFFFLTITYRDHDAESPSTKETKTLNYNEEYFLTLCNNLPHGNSGSSFFLVKYYIHVAYLFIRSPRLFQRTMSRDPAVALDMQKFSFEKTIYLYPPFFFF